MSTEAADPAGHRFGDFEFHPSRRQLFVRGQPATLGARALDVLTVLVERRDRMVSKGELMDLVWPGLVVEENNLQVQISALRKVLGADAIATNPGRGYRFTAILEPAAGAAKSAAPQPHERPRRRASDAASSLRVSGNPHNLPLPDNELIGRASDCELLAAELAGARLVTVVGPAGIGKTRVALAVAHAMIERYTDGVWWTDLAALASADPLADAIATATGQPLAPGDAASSLARTLRPCRMLIVLDNCEHLAAELAPLLRRVLEAAPGVQVLATSQVPLHLGSERCYRIEPLQMPAEGAPDDVVRSAPALALLLERARTVDRRFVLADAQLPLAISLCRDLDGLPLAIELAAARLPTLGLEALHGMLSQRFDLLNSARADVPRRQQALQAALDWSCRLLSPDELDALQRLSTFTASFRLANALDMVATDSTPAAAGILSSLVAKSLVQHDPGEPGCFRLLESTRMHAAGGLLRSGRADAARASWRATMARLARASEAEFWESGDEAWLGAFANVQPDVVAALEDSVAAGDLELAGDLAQTAQLWDYLQNIGGAVLRRKTMARTLLQPLAPHEASHARCAGLWNVSTFFMELQPSRPWPSRFGLESRLAAWRERGDARQVYRALGALAMRHSAEGDAATTRQLLAEAARLASASWPPRLLASHAYASAFANMLQREARAYHDAAAQMLTLCRRAGATQDELRAGIFLADAMVLSGQEAKATPMLEALCEESAATGQAFGQVGALALLSFVHLLAHDTEGARAIAARALPVAREQFFADTQLAGAALIGARRGRLEDAARLLGSCIQQRFRGNVGWANEARVCEQTKAMLAAALQPAHLAALLVEGAALSRDQRIGLMQRSFDPSS
ncbi:ATP-binding protein [Scleromatobacter humisilvae]|uniref:Helix-turn-helix transcriptional regulator n=1 Tax=Scleromatobacter humisilvae TaxID=2897159 RepID=A0A9X2BYS0_9BURK|nr:winged helix-turn-helix domain-containing protein [Scleromatobacter humisilvae]MCK9684511.1 helix-turn-helix transcriptional regulator [Scleromatobacter humisilvae]